MSKLLLFGAVVAAGCMPSYHTERPPLPEPTSSTQAACYRAKRFALSHGTATWRKQYESGGFRVTETWGSQGITFRKGDRLVDAVDAVAMLPDPGLVKGYGDALGETAGSHAAYPRYRTLAFGLALGGLGLVVGALGVVLVDVDSPLVLPLALGGAAVAVTSVVPTILASRHYDRAVEHDLDRHMYRRTEWAGRAVAAVRSYNERIAADCQYAPADLPITPRAGDLLGPAALVPPAASPPAGASPGATP